MIDFTNRDFNSIKESLIEYIKSMTDEWNDTNASDPAMIFINTLAGVSSMLNFYIDKQANENFINLAKEDKNIISLLELLNYKRPLRVPARATQVFEVVANQDAEATPSQITLPKYTPLNSADNSKTFILGEEITILSTDTIKECSILEGNRNIYNYLGSTITGYKFYLPTAGISEEDFKLEVDNVSWTKCENAFLKFEGGRYYSLHRDAFDSHYILLSHNYSNYIKADSKVKIEFISCEGNINYPPNTVVSLSNNSTSYDNFVRTYNKDYFSGGFSDNDIMLDRAKIQAKSKLLNKLVRLEDYEAYIDSYEGISDSKCVDCSVAGFKDIKPYKIVAYLILDANVSSSEAFLAKLYSDIKEIQTYSNSIELRDGNKVTKSINIEYIPKSNYVDTKSLNTLITNTLTSLYSKHSFDRNLLREEILTKVLQVTNEVATVNIIQPEENFYPKAGEYFVVDTVTVKEVL